MLISRNDLHPVVMGSPVTNLQNTSTEFNLKSGLESLELWYIRLPGSSGRFRLVDVEVYQVGWRNSFEQTLHSNGFIYATDNGAKSEFGNRSMDWTDVGEPISPYDSNDNLRRQSQECLGVMRTGIGHETT